jgi:LuxR family maltose regulon positive regulatory protein
MSRADNGQVSTEYDQLLVHDIQIPVVWTRLTIPQQGAIHLRRQRLIDTLHNTIDRKLTLVRAPAGYGKTSLLVDLAHETDLAVCWYALEPQSSDLGVFLTHLIATMARRFPSFGGRSARALQDMGGQVHVQLRIFVATFVDEILNTIPEYFFLILDDYHNLDESSNVHEFIRLLIDFMPEQCHMIISSRTVPPLPLIRLVARQQMAAIGVDELRFTEHEVRELLAHGLDVALPTTQVRLLTQHTDGWVTAILLSANTGWDTLSPDQRSPAMDLTETGIYDYLMNEVFGHQPQDVQTFLLRTAVLSDMTVSLCNALLDQESRMMLRGLEKHNLFISRVEQEGLETTYRYPPLFRDFLLSRLRREDMELYRKLNARAGELFAERRNWRAALTHSLEAERFLEVKDIILSHFDDLDKAGHCESLAQWIDLLPTEYLSPDLQLRRAELANQLGQLDTALRMYTNAIVHYQAHDNTMDLALALIERSYALSRTGSYEEATEDCQSALLLIPGRNATESLRGRAYRYLGIYYAETGDPTTALRYLDLAHQCWTQSGDASEHLARLAQTMAMAHEMRADFAAALNESQKALSMWESLGNEAGVADALNGIGVAHHRLGEYRTALEALEEALSRSRAAGSIRAEAYCLASLGDLYRDLGQFSQALSYYDQAHARNLVIAGAFLQSYITNARAETLYLAGQIERAQAEIEQTLAQEQLPQTQEAQQRILLAATLLNQRHHERARRELESVLGQPGLQNEIAFRGHMQLAQVAMVEDQPLESERHLSTAIQLAQDAGLAQPLCVESLNHLPVLEFVVQRGNGSRELGEWIDAAQELARTRKELAGLHDAQAGRPCGLGLRIDAFGASRVLMDGEVVSWRTTQAKELFFYLLTHLSGQTKEQIGAVIWPDHSPARLASIFRSSLFRVRKALFSEAILYDGERYRLDPDMEYEYDVRVFEDAFTQARLADNPVQKAHHYRHAVATYQGLFLADVYADWVQHFREALQAQFLQALTYLSSFSLDNRNYPQAISYSRQILSVDPHHEVAYQILVRSYVRSGQRPRAKRIYESYAEMLAEFDLEPEQSWEELCQ